MRWSFLKLDREPIGETAVRQLPVGCYCRAQKMNQSLKGDFDSGKKIDRFSRVDEERCQVVGGSGIS